jgi:hypothetical protein
MTNEIAKSNGQQEIDPFQDYANEVASRAHIVGNLLRFTKHGEYKSGQDQETIEEGTRMLAYMPSMKRGWVKWVDQAPEQHLVGLVIEGYRPPNREDLGDMDESEWGELNGKPIDPWQKVNYLTMCDGSGQLYTFATSSKGGLSAVGELSDAYAKRRRMKPDEIPMIELYARSYNHKDYGETFAPSLKIIGWSKVPDTFNDLSTAMDASSDETLTLEDMNAEPAAEQTILNTGAKAPTAAKVPAAKPKAPAGRGKPPPPSRGKGGKGVRF